MKPTIPITASFHITKACNFKCKFCYATFNDSPNQTMTLSEGRAILFKLKESGLQKITFAGGEPLLYPHLKELIIYAKSIGLTTSIITNGELLTYDWLEEMRFDLDWIGVSVDSFSKFTNKKIGRFTTKDYLSLFWIIKNFGYKLKINTVISKYNIEEDFNTLIDMSKPDRWKVFQVLKPKELSQRKFESLSITEEEFNSFLDKHKHNKCLVPENNELMADSYLLVDYLGRFIENTPTVHKYSDSIIHNNVIDCYNQINVSEKRFIERGGIYKW